MWFFACLLDHAYAPPYVCILLDSYNIPLQIVLQLHAYVLSAMQPPPRKPSPRLFSLGARRNPLSGALICDISHTMSVQQAARPFAAIPAHIHSTPIVFWDGSHWRSFASHRGGPVSSQRTIFPFFSSLAVGGGGLHCHNRTHRDGVIPSVLHSGSIQYSLSE